ncbi:MAG: HAD-IG family 5'-nucleotidase [Bdellovibrionales bacterium]|nr:HAD-IG family 5'-nucleotidase [Bdellovibrionales bacterium]
MSSYNNVYVNRTLNMKHIHYIGLDMDHTLIRYKSENFEKLAHKAMIDKLISDLGYPQSLKSLQLDYSRAIRGLVIDKARGNLLKLSRHAAIRESYHGLTRIDYKAQKKLYKSTYIDLSDSNFDTVDTSFSVAFATLFAQLVDLKDGVENKSLPDYNTMAADLTIVLDRAHRDGTIKDEVKNNLEEYIIPDKELVLGLERYKRHGKKIFVLTNSEFFYTKLLLDYAIQPYLTEHKSWEDLFEFVITMAQKPRFFYDNLKFLRIDPKDGSMTNLDGKLEKGGIYQGGCAHQFTSDLNLSPDEILYIGDHIYGDIVRLKKDCSWRTALVVEELDDEVENLIKVKNISEKIEALMREKVPVEKDISDLISDQIEHSHKKNEAQISENMKKIETIDKSISALITERQKEFNPYWGEFLRAGIEESYIAYQIERFACIYMAKLADLFSQSPRTYFRSELRLMPHELI